MQNLISFLCLDNLLYQYLSVRFLSQIVKIEEKPLSAFVAQSHVPRRFIQVSLKTTVPDARLFRKQIGKSLYHQVLRFVNVMQIPVYV